MRAWILIRRCRWEFAYGRDGAKQGITESMSLKLTDQAAANPVRDAAGDAAPTAPRARRRNGEAPPSTVNAVASALKILFHLSAVDTPIGVTPLARVLGLNTSTCFNILKTLVRDNLVEFDEKTKTYTIGMGVVDLAKGLFARDIDVSTVRPIMEQVAQKHGITVSLLRRIKDNRSMIVQIAVSDAPVRISLSVGQILPLLLGAQGQVMAAFSGLDAQELRRQFDLLNFGRPISFDTFMSNVEDTRRRGWSVDEGYIVRGTVSISVPVFDRVRLPMFACSATMFSGQYDADNASLIAQDLRAIGDAIERRLNG
jgi:DNA-binding IclR family transcriptional regulator